MVNAVVVIAQHRPILERLGLLTLEQAQAFQGGTLVKHHRGRRDIIRINTQDETGRPLVLYLKRSIRPYKKDGLSSLLRRGKVWSVARQEWENTQLLAQHGFPVPTPVAFGESCGPLWEHASFLVTEAAPGSETLLQFLRRCPPDAERKSVLRHLAVLLREFHQAGFASPDLFARHIFLRPETSPPSFCFIDMARLDHQRRLSPRRRARDLAVLQVSVPRSLARLSERLDWLKAYLLRDLPLQVMVGLIQRRVRYLLRRKRNRVFFYQTIPQRTGGRRL